jgi:ankyrin repeat protein
MTSNNESLFLIACEQNARDLVKTWIENGVDINTEDENGRNALHLGILY